MEQFHISLRSIFRDKVFLINKMSKEFQAPLLGSNDEWHMVADEAPQPAAQELSSSSIYDKFYTQSKETEHNDWRLMATPSSSDAKTWSLMHSPEDLHWHLAASPDASSVSSPGSIVQRSWWSRTFAPMGPGSLRGAVFTLVSGSTGAGILSLPWAVYKCGFLLGNLMVILGGFTFIIYYRIIVKGMMTVRRRSLMGLVGKMYGNVTRRSFEICLLIALFGCICAYLTIIANNLYNILTLTGILDPELLGLDRTRQLITLLFSLTVYAPLTIPRSLASLRHLSTMSLLIIIYLTSLVVIQTPDYWNAFQNSFSKIKWVNIDWHIADAVSIIVFAYNAVAAVPIIYTELDRRSYPRMKKVIHRGLSVCGMIYFLIGVCGYLSYMENMPSILTKRGSTNGLIDWPMIVAEGLIIVTLLGVIALSHNPLRREIEAVFFKGKEESQVRYWITNFSIVAATTFVAAAIPDAISYFKILGGLTSVPLSITLPAMIYFKITKNNFKLGVVTVWSLLLTVLGLLSALKTIMPFGEKA
jgi:amino acid permease